MTFNSFEEIADTIFNKTHSGEKRNPWTYGDAALDDVTSREFLIFSILLPQ